MSKKKVDPAGAAPAPAKTEPGAGDTFPIVGLGASAGGLEALELFFKAMPADSGLAFVLVMHLTPHRDSLVTELIQRSTAMKVGEAAEGLKIQPGRVYVIPPDYDLALLNRTLHLVEPRVRHGLRLPIDSFFRSLADAEHERAIGIILSGTGSDGSEGIRAIHHAGGLVIVQEPESAGYSGMPTSAIDTHMVDYVVRPDQMPVYLLKYARLANRQWDSDPEGVPSQNETLQKIFNLLRRQTRRDFSQYKLNTVHRRTERRMTLNQIETAEDYLDYLQEHPAEVAILVQELLIGVTNFFRDPEFFAIIEKEVIPKLLQRRSEAEAIRVWVAGISTGEEVYSLAILLAEALAQQNNRQRVQIFATDINGESVAAARAGLFPEGIAAHVSEDRLDRFFTRQDHKYQVKPEIREMIVFAVQDLLTDPPFSRLDMVSCRNLLIYLQPEAQRRLLQLFHYSLAPHGYLLLGPSEGVGELQDRFRVVNRPWKIFQRKEMSLARLERPDFSPVARLAERPVSPSPRPGQQAIPQIAQMLLQNYVPPCVIVDEAYNVIYFHGRTSPYLQPPRGEPTWNLLELARAALRGPLATLTRRALAENRRLVHDHLSVKSNGETHVINLVVYPVTDSIRSQRLLLVAFEAVTEPAGGGDEPQPAGEMRPADGQVAELQKELEATRQYLQVTVEELETSNEELKSANEELQSANEELQSTNEELETTKEELQSVNEELITVNSELQQKVEELSQNSNDMQNLLASTEIGTLFLDNDLRLKRFTPAVTKHIRLIPGDIGRPISDVVSNLDYATLTEDATQVLDRLVSKEIEVQTTDATHWYRMRIMPYRTMDNVIDGVVITFFDITGQKQLEEEISRAKQQEVALQQTIQDLKQRLGETKE